MTEQELADKIDEWHQTHTNQLLHEWLGWTHDQYKAWVETGQQPSPQDTGGK